jgi:hypothetical protein
MAKLICESQVMVNSQALVQSRHPEPPRYGSQRGDKIVISGPEEADLASASGSNLRVPRGAVIRAPTVDSIEQVVVARTCPSIEWWRVHVRRSSGGGYMSVDRVMPAQMEVGVVVETRVAVKGRT